MSAAVTEANTLTRQLWHIAGSGDLEQLDELMTQGADVNAGDRTGVTALMRAAYHGQLAMVRALIEHGADPNAKDRSGLTASMMAEHADHEEIVEALRSFGAKGKTEVARKPRLVGSVTENNVDAATQHDDSEFGTTSQTARILHEPMEIWELVQTSTQPYSPSASPGRVLSVRVLALALGTLIICSGAVFGFLALRGAMSESDYAPQQRPEATALKRTSSSNQQLSASESLTKAPGKISRSANELTKLKPVEKLMGKRVDPPTVSSSVSSAKKSSSQRPKATKVSAAFPKPNKNVRMASKLESEEDASSKSAKKEAAPAVSDPVKRSTTQKPKVIQWPNQEQ